MAFTWNMENLAFSTCADLDIALRDDARNSERFNVALERLYACRQNTDW